MQQRQQQQFEARKSCAAKEQQPIVLSQNRYKRILGLVNNTDKLQHEKCMEQQQQYHAQLKAGGEALLALFSPIGVLRTEAQRIADLQKQVATKGQNIKEQNNALSATFAEECVRLRNERIAEAKLLIEKLRPGPRALQSAQMQSEILRALNLQCKLKDEFKAAAEQQRVHDNKQYEEQINDGIRKAQDCQRTRQQKMQQYKYELQLTIEERSKKRTEERERALAEQRAACKLIEQEFASKATKERVANEHKRKAFRRNALEAINMVEEQRKRNLMLDELEQCSCELYNMAKSNLETVKEQQSKERVNKRLIANEQLAVALAPRLRYSASKDDERYARVLQQMRAAHSVNEQARRERIKAAKTQRIAMQKEEQLLAQQKQEQAQQQKQKDMALRKQNEAVYSDFKQAQRQQQQKQMQELRQVLVEQVRTREASEVKPDIDYNRNAQLENLKEDKFFFDYAIELMSAAKKHNYPLQPFVRAIDEYKRANNIDKKIKMPKHLVSKLTMGLRTPGDSQSNAKLAAKQATEQNDELHENMQAVLNNCKKIKELMRSTTANDDATELQHKKNVQ